VVGTTLRFQSTAANKGLGLAESLLSALGRHAWSVCATVNVAGVKDDRRDAGGWAAHRSVKRFNRDPSKIASPNGWGEVICMTWISPRRKYLVTDLLRRSFAC
jgi:hypothetical protein